MLLLSAALVSGVAVAQTDAPAFDVSGVISTVNGTPIENVVVSDGYTVVVTDAKGAYRFNRHIRFLPSMRCRCVRVTLASTRN